MDYSRARLLSAPQQATPLPPSHLPGRVKDAGVGPLHAGCPLTADGEASRDVGGAQPLLQDADCGTDGPHVTRGVLWVRGCGQEGRPGGDGSVDSIAPADGGDGAPEEGRVFDDPLCDD